MRPLSVLAIVAGAILQLGLAFLLIWQAVPASSKPSAPAARFDLRPVIRTAPAPCPSGQLADSAGKQCYLLEPGMQSIRVNSAVAAQNPSSGQWSIRVELSGKDAAAFDELTTRLYQAQAPRNQLAIVIDGKVVAAPNVMGPISGGSVEISGSYTRDTAGELAGKLAG
ncbi:MAG: hypothetical protein HOU01_17970 [Streptomycetaceae bacterium]|nr:hypothetical protein [Streptomycetaceae bacterium]